MIQTDSLFRIGKHHTVCQDYTGCGSNYIIVSDGCSSSPDTDFGSRLLVRHTDQILRTNPRAFDPKDVIGRAAESVKQMKFLPMESLDATLLVAWVEGNDYKIYVCGDGVIAKTRQDDTVEITWVEFLSGAPRYLSYDLDPVRYFGYLEMFSAKRSINQIVINPDGSVSSPIHTADDYVEPLVETGNASDYKNITLFSDGVCSFRKETINPNGTSREFEDVALTDVVKQLVAYKNYEGPFLQRRVQKFAKDCDKWHWHHQDDLGIAALHLDLT